MAKEYFEKLLNLIIELKIADEVDDPWEVKHFFSGAAFYVDGSIRVTWTPVGLAFKLQRFEVDELISSGKANPLKYFSKGKLKKDYALFKNPTSLDNKELRSYFIKAAQINGH